MPFAPHRRRALGTDFPRMMNSSHPRPAPCFIGAPPVVVIFGGTGFLGRHLVRHLAAQGYVVRVVSRQAARADYLKTMGNPGQIVLMSADLTRPESIAPVLSGATAVVNLVGVLFESGRQQFPSLHAQAPEQLAKLARAAGIKQFVHISALGVERAVNSKYARTKSMGEKAVRSAFPEATILRPSVIFGPEDNFFNQFARLATFSPMLPLIGGGKSKFQTVFVGDVAQAVGVALSDPDTAGKTYELGGPATMTLKEIYEYILKHTNRRACLLPVPFELAAMLALGTEWLPHPPMTRDQVRLLEMDNVVQEGALTLADLGIQPTHPDDVVPDYLARFRRNRSTKTA